MSKHRALAQSQFISQSETWRYGWSGYLPKREEASRSQSDYWSFSITTTRPVQSMETVTPEETETGTESQGEKDPQRTNSGMTFLDFVEQRFVPEYIARMRTAGRAYFHGILKHVLTPEDADRAFQLNQESSRVKLKAIPGWPYMDEVRLCDIRPEHIQSIVAAVLERGYSTQTATHVRNVIRAILSYAAKDSSFSTDNPARQVTLPEMARKEAHVLSMDQLKQVIGIMEYPEREIALLSILSDMNVAEICGLQWKYVNLSEFRRMIDGEWIPSKTIAVRKQSYRCEFGMVMASRKRDISISDLLFLVLQNIKNRRKFTSREDFVVASRNGTPINQDNVAARRLKSIGRRLNIPWLSWNVFHRTRVALSAELGRQLPAELRKLRPIEQALARRSPVILVSQGTNSAI